MTNDEYRQAMEHVSLACRLLLNLGTSLDDCLRTVDIADTLAPVLDSTSYACGGARNLQLARQVIEPAIALRNAARSVDPDRLSPWVTA